MTPIYQGTTAITGCYRGTVEVSAIYRGTALVWQKIVAPTTMQIPVYPYVNSAKATTHASGTATSVTNEKVNVPPNVQAGDLLLLYTVMDSGSVATDLTYPAGWTQLGELSAGTSAVGMGVAWKVATASEPVQYTYARYAQGSDGASLMISVRGWDGVTGNLVYAQQQTTRTLRAVPSVTPKTARGLMFMSAHHDNEQTAAAGVWNWVAPETSALAGISTNLGKWSSLAVAHEIYQSASAISGKNWLESTMTPTAAPMMTTALAVGGTTTTATALIGGYSGGSNGALTDRENQQFTDTQGITHNYHIYASGLDWTKDVGIMIYTDGSMEYGLIEGRATDYLLNGPRGIRAVAKKHNMVLLTPMAPGGPCADGDGVCWYDNSPTTGMTPDQKYRWSKELIELVYSQYNICKSRVAIGGYSSGAQWSTQWFVPADADKFMTDGVVVPIAYGGKPKVPVTNTSTSFKQNVPIVWDVGELDEAYTGLAPTYSDGIVEGEQWYKTNGYNTRIMVAGGLGHDRYVDPPDLGEYGRIMDKYITMYVAPAQTTVGGGTVTPPPTPPAYQAAPSNGSTGVLEDRNAVAFSTSSYHIRAAHLAGKSGPFPVIFHWHGDGAEEYTAPTTSTLPAYAAEAVKHGAILIVPRTPDNTQPITWWEANASITYSVNLMTEIFNKYNVDKKRIFLSGYSGGAELISYNHLVDYHTMFLGGGAMMLGGGGVVYDDAGNKVAFTGTPTQSLKDQFFLNWEVGDGDNGIAPSDTTIDALTSSRDGEEFYRLAGFKTERNIIPNVNHFTSEPYGPAKLTNLINKSNTYYGLPTV